MQTSEAERRELLVELRATATGSDDTAFANAVDRAMSVLGMLDAEVAEQIGVSRTTVNRWRNGTVVPHPVVRPHVLRVLADRCEVLVRSEERKQLRPVRKQRLQAAG
jgi:transcriptional regulator with XRE-family HTH domain